MKFSKQNIIIGTICLMLFSISIYIISQKHFYQSVYITIEAKVEKPDMYQLFYDTGKNFNEEESVKIEVYPSNDFQSIVFKIPTYSTIIKSFRIDPGYQTKNIEIKQISLKTRNQSLFWGPEDILAEFSYTADISTKEVKNEILHFETSGSDPRFIYTGNSLATIDLRDTVKKIVLYALSCIFFLFLFSFLLLFKKNFFEYIENRKFFNNSDFRFIIIFITILLIPLSQMVFNYIPETTTQENRNFAEFPDIHQLSKIGLWDNYIKSFESFFNDHYGLRNLLIKTNSVIHTIYLNTSPRSDVIIGKDGWLFYNSPINGVNINDYYGETLFSDQEITTIQKNLLRLKSTLKAQGINLVVVLAANKHTIYDEYLPNYIQKNKGLLTRADQIKNIMKETEILYIDTRPILLKAKKEYQYPLYYKTDTHWNDLGGFVVSQEIVKTIATLGYRVHKLTDNSSYINSEKTTYWHDLGGFINLEKYKNDTNFFLTTPKNYTYTEEKLYGGRHDSYVVTTLKQPSYGKILVFRDSFASALIPYLSESFSRAVYVWSPSVDYNLIKAEKPDIVIIEFVERLSDVLLNIN